MTGRARHILPMGGIAGEMMLSVRRECAESSTVAARRK